MYIHICIERAVAKKCVYRVPVWLTCHVPCGVLYDLHNCSSLILYSRSIYSRYLLSLLKECGQLHVNTSFDFAHDVALKLPESRHLCCSGSSECFFSRSCLIIYVTMIYI